MHRSRYLTVIAPIGAILLALALPASAEEPLVKLAPTPAPSSGPTVAAAEAFCGDPSGKAEELIARYSAKPELKRVYKSDQYVAYSDDEKNSHVMYTFTVKGHPAHPAAVCRKPVQQGDNLVITMSVVCDGESEACAKLQNDFNVMTAKMQAEVDQQIQTKKN